MLTAVVEMFAYCTFLFVMMNMNEKNKGQEKLWFCHYHFCFSDPAFELNATGHNVMVLYHMLTLPFV